MKTLITGITGQDGSYLAEHLALEGHEVYGVIRNAQHSRREWLEQLVPTAHLVEGDLLDRVSLERVLRDVRPDEIYNLAAVTAPGAGWDVVQPSFLAETTALGVAHLLAATASVVPDARVVHASSSAIYDPLRYGPYGVAKRFAHDVVRGYRSTGLHASNAVFFSHTSVRQSERFLVRRVVRHVVDVAHGRSSALQLTNVGNRRDWGHAPDYVRAMVIIARQERPGDHDVRTGETHSVRDVVTTAADIAGVTWAAVSRDWWSLSLVAIDDEVWSTGSSCQELGWASETTFEEMIRTLVQEGRDVCGE